MKKFNKIIAVFAFVIALSVAFVGCGGNKPECNNDITLQSYTNGNISVVNNGVTLECVGDNTFKVGGTIKDSPSEVLTAFNFKETEKHIVSLKLKANKTVEKENFALTVKGPTQTNTFDQTALDGDDYTYLLLAFDAVTDEKGYEITVKWNKDDQGTTYRIIKADGLKLVNSSLND